MRRTKLHDLVRDLITDTWNDANDNADVAKAVLSDDDALGALCHRLDQAGNGDPAAIKRVWLATVRDLGGHTLDFIAEAADSPAAFLASQF